MTAIRSSFELKLQTLPTATGVYLFKDEAGKVIYIGKAKNLRNRVRTYFHSASRHDPKTAHLVKKIRDVELMVTENEIESLILEANMVREKKPRYNVNLKDDKHFPYIKITTNEPFPRVLVVRRLERDNATYFGPYTSAKGMRRTLDLLTRLFKIRTCNLVIPHPKGEAYKVCLDYQINRCGGPCEDLQSQEDYAESVNAVILALSGKSAELVATLTKRMNSAAEKEKFEEAREYRDQLQGLEKLRVKQHVDVGEIIDRDIVSIARDGSDGVAVVMQIRQGVLLGRQDFQLAVPHEELNETMLETFLKQYYNNQPNLPQEIFIPAEIADMDLMQRWLSDARGSTLRIITPRRGGKVKMVELAARNARLLLDEVLIQRRQQAERTSKMVTSLQEALSLRHTPRTIVCFDISNTGDTDAVGSCAYFDNGRPKKSEYRQFKIKGDTVQDDFRMMREIIGRYFFRLNEEQKELPDLVVVDGGKGQLSAALAELHSLKIEGQAVIGLAKRLEEVFLPGESDPVTIARSSPALLLLKRIRDEAHRFAVKYNRKVRSKRTITSALDNVQGIGPAKRQALLSKFGSVAKISTANIEELTAVRGITPQLAERILSRFRSREVQQS